MTEYLYICEYLGVTPQQFFDQDNDYPASVNELLQYAKNTKKENVEILLDVALDLSDSNKHRELIIAVTHLGNNFS